MMLKMQEESLPVIQREFMALVYSYWYATPQNADHVALEFDWEQYKLLETVGLLRLYTARDEEEKLVGVALYIIVCALHHKDYKIADCDTLATDLEHRGIGIGSRLLEFSYLKLRAIDVKEIINRSRHILGPTKLFQKHGFTAIETVHSKKVT